MTRIISGIAGSIRLKGPAKSTRPTSDRVKESVFSILESMGAISNSRVLDLFAGTGALGLEAASRGADSVILVELDPLAASVCSENLQLIQATLQKHGLVSQLSLENSDAMSFLIRDRRSYDLAFIDPPYDTSNQTLASIVLEVGKRLARSGLLVIERSARSDAPELTPALKLFKTKRFGDTTVYFVET